MKYLILCGGIGKRCNNYSLPKPLNLIQGRHMIEYIIENIPSNEIYIIYNIFLNDFNFCEIIINKFKTKQFHFSSVDYLTRGAVETAYIGIQKFEGLSDENIVFIDNDNIHTFPDFKNKLSNDFVGYSMNYDLTNTNYSFIKIINDKIVNIVEKNKISDTYCCGIYGFKNAINFNTYAKKLLDKNYKTKNEFYFSQLYKLIIEDNKIIEPIFIENTKHIGSYNEIIDKQNIIAKNKLRICFDLDNTLCTYPTIPNDYTSVKPIHKNIELLHNLKNDGHEIIIYTARRMLTHKGNIGKVIKDIALITINTLDKFGICYDELIFGKPIADIYIDDRAINPYINNISYFGLFYKNDDFIPNKIENNKYNKIEKYDNYITKLGPYNFIKGELFYYQNIPIKFKEYFPTLISFNKIHDNIELKIDYIKGIPLFYLYKNKLITDKIIDDLFDILNKFHTHNAYPQLNITDINIHNNYFKKLQKRFNKNDYYFDDSDEVFAEIMDGLLTNYSPHIVKMIHGDFWFSNIIMTYDDNYKFIDMKGQIDDILTINGDIYYDYGKMYQSILGYDLILNNENLDHEYLSEMNKYFLEKCEKNGLNIKYLKYVAKSLIFGSFHAIDDKKQHVKEHMWMLIKSII